MQRIYLETSVISYFTARDSRDLSVQYHQAVTRKWWETQARKFEVCISEAVLAEIGQGDENAAAMRISMVAECRLLHVSEHCETLARRYIQGMNLPPRARIDALHLAVASVHEVDFLVTWNCAHIANPHTRVKLEQMNIVEGLRSPVICTPEELFYAED